MPGPLLSAAMIVRDAEERLPGCLESIRDLVDEIVIVDTGSTDASVEIARSFGARVHFDRWQDDFAQARNVGLDLTRGRWILHLDADERLRPVATEAVRSRLQEAGEIALRVLRRPFAGATPHWGHRLWRSDPRIRFAGIVHESVIPAIRAVAAEDRLSIGASELCLEHSGYDGDQLAKQERYLPLLRAQLALDPNSAYNWSHLAEVLAAVGETAESEAALEQAVCCARQDTSAPAGGMAFAEMIRRRREGGEAAEDLLAEALELYPDCLALAWQRVCVEVDAGRHVAALRWLERFDVDPAMPVEELVSYPAALLGAEAPAMRGLCLFRLGRYREAAAAYARAEAFEPDQPEHRVKRILAERFAGRPGA